MLLGSETLLELRESMILAVSSLSVGCRISQEKCLCEYFMVFFVVSAIDAK